MRILGVDPGSQTTGWGVVEGSPARPRYLRCGAIRLPRGLAFADRLHRLRSEFVALVRELRPAAAAVEAPFHGVNASTALRLAHARGVLLEALAAHDVPIAEYTPAMVKKSVTGNGRAEKRQVQAMVTRLLRLEQVEEPGAADRADALAVALCHLNGAGLERAIRRAR